MCNKWDPRRIIFKVTLYMHLYKSFHTPIYPDKIAFTVLMAPFNLWNSYRSMIPVPLKINLFLASMLTFHGSCRESSCAMIDCAEYANHPWQQLRHQVPPMRRILPAKYYLFWFDSTAVFRSEIENDAIISVDDHHWNVCQTLDYMIVDSKFVFVADLSRDN